MGDYRQVFSSSILNNDFLKSQIMSKSNKFNLSGKKFDSTT